MPLEPITVCVLTSRGMAAISSIAVRGPGTPEILAKIFREDTVKERRQEARVPLTAGHLLHGAIVEDEHVIDEVVIGCEGPDEFVIHCHGNPLLVEQIVKLVQSYGASFIDADSFTFARYRVMSANAIEAEAQWMMQKSATLFGVKILQSQIEKGLSKWVTQTLENIDSITSDEIKSQCKDILKRSNIAEQIIKGVKIAIAGPPNSGKSTLFNCLAGQQQVIVSETAGTTRDWVSITCNVADRAGMKNAVIQAEFIDTAGLDDVFTSDNPVEQAAQGMTRRILEYCDLVLYVQDITAVRSQQSENRCHVDKPVIYVKNKCDLIQQYNEPEKQEHKCVTISAKNNSGIDVLMETIMNVLGVADFNPAQPIVFTERQSEILTEMLQTNQSLQSLLDKLLFSESS